MVFSRICEFASFLPEFAHVATSRRMNSVSLFEALVTRFGDLLVKFFVISTPCESHTSLKSQESSMFLVSVCCIFVDASFAECNVSVVEKSTFLCARLDSSHRFTSCLVLVKPHSPKIERRRASSW